MSTTSKGSETHTHWFHVDGQEPNEGPNFIHIPLDALDEIHKRHPDMIHKIEMEAFSHDGKNDYSVTAYTVSEDGKLKPFDPEKVNHMTAGGTTTKANAFAGTGPVTLTSKRWADTDKQTRDAMATVYAAKHVEAGHFSDFDNKVHGKNMIVDDVNGKKRVVLLPDSIATNVAQSNGATTKTMTVEAPDGTEHTSESMSKEQYDNIVDALMDLKKKATKDGEHLPVKGLKLRVDPVGGKPHGGGTVKVTLHSFSPKVGANGSTQYDMSCLPKPVVPGARDSGMPKPLPTPVAAVPIVAQCNPGIGEGSDAAPTA